MNELLKTWRREARKLAASLRQPSFASTFAGELRFSRNAFFDHPDILRLQEDALPFLYDEYGIGVEHAKQVAVEASAITLAETLGLPREESRRLAHLAMIAGLLHDICRLEEHHADHAAELAGPLLAKYSLSPREQGIVTGAIRSHVAPLPEEQTDPELRVVAAAVHDADVFRWGPDIFGTMLWELIDYEEAEGERLCDLLPQALQQVRAALGSFRSGPGRSCGPELLQLGESLIPRLRELLTMPAPGRLAAKP